MALRPTGSSSSPLADREAAQQDGFLREVDEALREEEFFAMLKRYGKPLGFGIVAVLLGFGGYLYWDNARSEAAATHAVNTVDALDKLEGGNREAAAKAFAALAKDGTAGSKAIAALTHAGISAEQGKPQEAAKAFAVIAADSSVPQPLRDLATVREVGLAFDTMAPDSVIARLKPLAVPGNPWFGSAGEMVALAYLKQGKVEMAGPLLVAIAKDKDAPESLRARVRQLAAQLGFDAIDDVKKLAGPENAPAAAQ